MTDKNHANHPANNGQAAKFRDMARELEADETPSVFERALRKIVAAPVPPKEAKPVHKREG